jgi:hypothetical protein
MQIRWPLRSRGRRQYVCAAGVADGDVDGPGQPMLGVAVETDPFGEQLGEPPVEVVAQVGELAGALG